jgi:CBS domain-containing protein
MRISEVMTQGVVTADSGDTLQHVGELMREHNVGSVVICESGRPVGVITDRDLALAVVADRIDSATEAGEHASRPIVTSRSRPRWRRRRCPSSTSTSAEADRWRNSHRTSSEPASAWRG